MKKLDTIRTKRLELQKELDSQKNALDRNKLGQYATPSSLADSILELGLSVLPEGAGIRFIDPAIGLGSFYDSLTRVKGSRRITKAYGVEIDPHYFAPSSELWAGSNLELTNEDFTNLIPPDNDDEKFNLLICNPPYVRHHHMKADNKSRLQQMVLNNHGIKSSKLMGLYGYFLILSHKWLQQDGISVWLIPTEFMDVNYGQAIKEYLSKEVSLIRLHTFKPEDVQFDDALVSSTVVLFKNAKPNDQHEVVFSLGGTLEDPRQIHTVTQSKLNPDDKWSKVANGVKVADAREAVRFSDIFDIKRGIATGSNSFFIMTKQEAIERKIPDEFLQPILPSSRYISNRIIEANDDGTPMLEKDLFLLNCRLPEHIVKRDYPDLWKYLEDGKAQGISDGYICRNRKPWYKQELRASPDLVVGYMGRSRTDSAPFKFYVNRSKAIAANSYLMIYLKPEIKNKAKNNASNMHRIIKSISSVTEEVFLEKGRSYGGGLHKLEPKELANVPLYNVGDLVVGNASLAL